MKIESIKAAGSSNLLKWAINLGANLTTEESLREMINDETFFLVTLSDVNFFEVFRMVQTYREKLRIITRNPAVVPEISELEKYFPGEIRSNDGKESMKLAEMAKMTADTFMNIALQMNSDNDIISPEVTQLYTSMISMKYTIQFPVGFSDILSSLKTPEDISAIFNKDYPQTLDGILDTKTGESITMLIQLMFIRYTSIIKYNQQFEKLLSIYKYSPLKKAKYNDKMYKLALLGFHKYDPIARSEVRCTMFNANKDELQRNMNNMKRINNPLKATFVIQMPIHYMMMLENSFSRSELAISYEASMTSIIAEDIRISDFVTSNLLDVENEEAETKLNAISAYKNRIEEANQALLNLIPILITPERECDITNTFALLPPAYTTKAVITIDTSFEEKYMHHFDGTILTMFEEIMSITKSILK